MGFCQGYESKSIFEKRHLTLLKCYKTEIVCHKKRFGDIFRLLISEESFVKRKKKYKLTTTTTK